MKFLSLRTLMAALAMMLAAGFSFADSDNPILKQAAERCAQFENEVKDMRMVQAMKSYVADAEITFEQTVYTKGQKSRVEMKMPLEGFEGGDGAGTVETIMINDGTNAWIISPFGGKKQLSPEEAERSEPSRNCWGYFPDNATVTGSETVQGRDCHIVELLEEGVTTRLWLDKRNFIPVKGETSDSTSTEHFRWTHSDFHTIHGDWEYPFTTQMYDGDSLAATMTVTALDVNQGLSDDLFDPEKVQVQPLDLGKLMQMMSADTTADSTRK
jgi:outer membrane lipoprotein-sorting protein